MVPSRMPEAAPPMTAAVPREVPMPPVAVGVMPAVAPAPPAIAEAGVGGCEGVGAVAEVRPAPPGIAAVETEPASVAGLRRGCGEQHARCQGEGYDELADHDALHGRPAAGRT